MPEWQRFDDFESQIQLFDLLANKIIQSQLKHFNKLIDVSFVSFSDYIGFKYQKFVILSYLFVIMFGQK